MGRPTHQHTAFGGGAPNATRQRTKSAFIPNTHTLFDSAPRSRLRQRQTHAILRRMAFRRLNIGHGALASLFVASLLVGSGCSGDSNTSFTDVAGNGPSSGDAANGGTDQATSGKGSGAEQSGGASAAGSGTHAGSANGGAQSSGGTDNGGTDGGGTDSGGTNNKAGTSSGGNGMAGTAGAAGTAGSAGAGGSAGTAGSAGAGGAAGSAGAGGSAGGNGGSAGMSGGGNGGTGGGCGSKPEVCDGIDNNCDNVADPPGTCPDGCTGALFGGHTYYLCGTVDNEAIAAAKCTNAGMVMISIETKAENDFVAGKVKGSTWLGASDEANEGEWLWLSSNDKFWTGGLKGGPVDGKYANWLALQPNDNGASNTHENCMVITPAGAVGSVTGGKWNDLNCGLKDSRWACESTGPAITPGGP